MIQVSSRGIFVGSEQKHLRHMNEDDGDHEVGAPSMHRADEPAKRNLMIQGLQAAPCFAAPREHK